MASESPISRLVELLEAVSAELMRHETFRTVLVLTGVGLALFVLWWVSSHEFARALDDDPEKELERALRETDRLIADVRTRLGKLVANEHMAKKHLVDAKRKHEKLSAQIERALEDGREDLAQVAVGEQLDIEDELASLEQSLASATATEHALQTYIDALLESRRETQAELQSLYERRRRQHSSELILDELHSNALMTAHAKSAVRDAQAQHAGLVLGNVPDVNGVVRGAALEKVARAKRIHERLSALKARRRTEDNT